MCGWDHRRRPRVGRELLGAWNGPYDTGFGNIASQPSAAFNDIGGISQVTVFWKSTTDNSLWYLRIANPASSNPMDGGLGSAPTIAWSAAVPSQLFVFWKGQDGYLNESFYNGASWKHYSFPGFGILG